MGKLVVRHYPTKLFLKAADHTYVECETGAKGWSCWGGKTTGNALRSATGSSLRADAIAGRKDRAGIKCYLVNGVCHQAANRIIKHAGITVDGARGYSLSVSLFGLHGREIGAFGLCKAPFNEYPNISGDLPACIGSMVSPPTGQDLPPPDHHLLDFQDQRYMQGVEELDSRTAGLINDPESLIQLQLEHFKLFVVHKLLEPGDRITHFAYDQLLRVREKFERGRVEAESELSRTENGLEFVRQFDELTLAFQDDVAAYLEPSSYQALLDLSPGERILLSDPDCVEQAYGGKSDTPGAAS